MRKKQEIEIEWELSEASKKVNSADQIDQLDALRFKTEMASKNLSRAKIDGILEDEMHVTGE